MSKKGAISRGIFKAMGIFGGTQMLTIICSIVRNKLVSVWLGPSGMGLFGLYNSAIDLINVFSNMGLRTSCVRDISEAFSAGNEGLLARVLLIVRRWSWFLGAVGAVLTMVLAPLLSNITFGDTSHAWGYGLLSVSVLLFSVMCCEQAVLQGTKRLKQLAKASVWGNAIGLLLSMPMYYYLRMDSVLPSILVYAIANAVSVWVLRNRDYDSRAGEITVKETVKGGAEFLKFGFCLTLSLFSTLLVSYVFMAYLNHHSDMATVGHYQAGYALVNRYSELFFAAIGMEYYPRLAGVAQSRRRVDVFVSQEVAITLWLLVPVIIVFLLCRGIVVDLLYAPDFQAMIPYISWCMVGLVFKGASWCLAYVILAKGESKVYLVTELTSSALCLVFNIVFFELWGLKGIGISYALWYLTYLLMAGVVYVKKFGISLRGKMLLHVAYATAMALCALWAVESGYVAVAVVLAVASGWVSIVKIRKSVGKLK
ncbi:MAG: oligosaccharide flippase family protein [Muribaculaceae bacterium]